MGGREGCPYQGRTEERLGPIHRETRPSPPKKLYLTNKKKSPRSTSHPMKPHKGYPTGNEEEAVRMEKESVEEGHRNRCG